MPRKHNLRSKIVRNFSIPWVENKPSKRSACFYLNFTKKINHGLMRVFRLRFHGMQMRFLSFYREVL